MFDDLKHLFRFLDVSPWYLNSSRNMGMFDGLKLSNELERVGLKTVDVSPLLLKFWFLSDPYLLNVLQIQLQ